MTARKPCVVSFSALVLGAVLASGAAAQPDPDTLEGDERAVYETHRALLTAYASQEIDELTALLDRSADLVIFHPRGNLQFESVPSVEWGLDRMLDEVGPSRWATEADNQVTVSGDVAWHTYKLAMVFQAEGEMVRVRGTEIWNRHGSEWRLVHAHWSEDDAPGSGGE